MSDAPNADASSGTRARLEALAAVAAPAVWIGALALCAVSPQEDRRRALISAWVVVFFNAALLASFVQALGDGSRAEPRALKWLNHVAADRASRLRAAGARFALLLGAGFAILFAMKRVIRVKLDLDSAMVVAGAYAALVLSFELGGWLLGGASLKLRRRVRLGAYLWLALALGHAAVEALLGGVESVGALLWSLLEGGPWRWFPFAGWVNAIYEALIQGERPPWLAVVAAASCGAASVVIYARRAS